MTLLPLARTTSRTLSSLHVVRGYASTSSPPPKTASESSKNIASLCPAGTVMNGLNYLKGEPPVLAKPDEEYPAWLWDLTKPKILEDDGPGGKVEKRRLRVQHRQMLKDNNLFKAK